MAMATWLHGVSDDQIEELRQSPQGVNRLSGTLRHHSYHFGSINFFLTGSAYPGRDNPLAPMLQGAQTIDCPTLETGGFGVLSAERVRQVADLLALVDLVDVSSKVEAADFGELVDEEEVEDLELLDEAAAPAVISKEVQDLAEFYRRVAEAGQGVVMYTT